jgi:esterase/lipase
MTAIIIISGFIILFVLGPRPKLNALAPASRVPADLPLAELDSWVKGSENAVQDLTPGAGACITWANPENPDRTELCFLYIHGFSATRQETAPVTDLVATNFSANAFHARLEGHGVGSEGMLMASETWLQSVIDAWSIAERLGNKVVIIATSTGAPLAIWLAEQAFTRGRIHAFLFMSPNFKIRSRFGFILTWPWAKYWVRGIVGKEISWEPENEMAAKYWTSTYSSLSLIEMQKVVDWLSTVDLSRHQIPLATMYMKNDSTIDPAAAISAHEQWGSEQKRLIPVTIDGDTEEHVFVGDITAPHRIDWCVNEFVLFLKTLDQES